MTTLPATPTRSTERTRPADTTADPDREGSTWTQRTVEAITDRLSTKGMGRRSFLTKAALIGSALAVDPIGFIIKPRTAWASVCGADNEFNEGWSAFCATINDGANTCPSGSFVAGWWKIDNTTFCSGRARYIVDCNRSPGSSCRCRSAGGSCDRRRVCCNNFRYGQCNTQISGTTEVVCRIVLCTPPWEWGNCTTTSLTSNQTRTHWSSRLPSRTDPTPIKVYWLEGGLTGSVLGDMVGSEKRTSDGGAWANFDRGVLTSTPNGTVRRLRGVHADAYARLDGADGPLGRPVDHAAGRPSRVEFADGSTYLNGNDVFAVWGPLDRAYQGRGGADEWMGPPSENMVTRGPHDILPTASGFRLVWSDTERRAIVLRQANDLPGDGSFPPTIRVDRWSGNNRYRMAANISRRSYRGGASTVLIVRGNDSPDGITAAAVSARLGAPVLLTFETGLASETRDEIQRLGATRAIVVGSRRTLSNNVITELRRVVDDVERWGGGDRWRTSVEVSRRAFPDGAGQVILANGYEMHNAVTVAPEAHQRDCPVLLVTNKYVPRDARREIERLGASHVVLAGSPDSISTSLLRLIRDGQGYSVRRIGGDNVYETSAAISNALGRNDEVTMTSGKSLDEALALSSYATRRGVPILRADDLIDPAVDVAIRRAGPDRIIAAGGFDTVSIGLFDQLQGYRG